jgi:hypothetical protein
VARRVAVGGRQGGQGRGQGRGPGQGSSLRVSRAHSGSDSASPAPLVHFHGVIAPRSSWRRDVVPKPPSSEHRGCEHHASKSPRHRKPAEPARRHDASAVQTAAVQVLGNAAPALPLSGAHATLLAPNLLAPRH